MSLDWISLGFLCVQFLLLLWLVLRRPASTAAQAADLEIELQRLDRGLRDEVGRSASATRQELAQTLAAFQQTLLAQQSDVARLQNEQIDSFRVQLATTQQSLADSLHRFSTTLGEQLRVLTAANDQRLAEVRTAVEARLTAIRDDNEKKLEQMRATVDEKLHATLEHRLSESFRLVAERLEKVHHGLSEMRVLAKDVGSLNRVLTNVKTRGSFGEWQLAALLEEVMTAEQYGRNVETIPGSGARVEFAIRMPGHADSGAVLWLPIDAKFPRDDYERLLEAQESGDVQAVAQAGKAIEQRLRVEARNIRSKYVGPPHTTEFAILFVPTEGLYAEALRRPGLVDALHREHRVMLAGPTTLLATLNSLQMGFRTLALEKRSAEVWQVLGAVKTEFHKFGAMLDKTRKKLKEASDTIDDAQTRTRVMGRKLKAVETMPEPLMQALLPGLGDSESAEQERAA